MEALRVRVVTHLGEITATSDLDLPRITLVGMIVKVETHFRSEIMHLAETTISRMEVILLVRGSRVIIPLEITTRVAVIHSLSDKLTIVRPRITHSVRISLPQMYSLARTRNQIHSLEQLALQIHLDQSLMEVTHSLGPTQDSIPLELDQLIMKRSLR